MGPPASHKLTGVRGTQDPNQAAVALLYGTLTPSGGAFQRLRVSTAPLLLVLQPHHCVRQRWFGLFPPRSPLLRESRLISLRRATEMFQFAHGPPACLCIQQAVSSHHAGRVAPFGFSGLSARMQLPLNVSPVSASFVGLQRLGIHRVLSRACPPLPLAHTLPLLPRFPLRLSSLLFTRLALGKIEVIMLFSFLMCQSGSGP